MSPAAKKQKILVVDDQPINIKLLQRKLEREGYEVMTAYNGQECLELVAKSTPDLILLDVMMPEMDGIETCERLKQSDETETIPVIFITAKSSKEGKLEGLGAGAVDYITKPIDLDETLARVRTQLHIQEIYRENIELQRRMGEIRRAAAVGAITQGIAHNLNNLLGVVVGYLDLLRNGYDSPDMVKRSVSLMDQAIQRMVGIIRHLSTIATSEKVQLTPVAANRLVQGAVERFREEYGIEHEILVTTELPDTFLVDANTEMFENVMLKLLSNAWEAYPKATIDADKSVHVASSSSDNGNYMVVKVTDTGSGIEEDMLEHIFDPFITTKTTVGRGLGLTMARHAMRNLKGDIVIESTPHEGTTAIVSYPVRQPVTRPAAKPTKPPFSGHHDAGTAILPSPNRDRTSTGVSRHD